MNKLYGILSKGMGFVYVYMKRIGRKRGIVHNNQVLIMATGHIGNAIMDAPAIHDLIVHYQQNKKEVYFFSSKTMWDVLNMLIDTSDVTFIQSDYRYTGSSVHLRSVRKILGIFKGRAFETLVVTLPEQVPLAHYLAAVLQVNESWGVFDNVKHTHKSPLFFFERYFARCFTNRIMVPIDMQETHRLKLLLKELGCTSHCTTIQFIPEQMEYPKRSPYITIAVDSATTERCWSAGQFIELSRLLLDTYPFDLYLTGSNVSEIDMEQYITAFETNTRVKNYIKKTGFKEWIEMIRHSQFHVGVDSGSIHVAASVGTQAFCLTGVWDGHRVMPYQVDKEDGRTVEPICIYRSDVDVDQLDCYACKVNGGKFGIRNNICYRESRKGNPCLCLQKIEAEDVFDIIRTHIEVS